MKPLVLEEPHVYALSLRPAGEADVAHHDAEAGLFVALEPVAPGAEALPLLQGRAGALLPLAGLDIMDGGEKV